jgi:hypothetical protein
MLWSAPTASRREDQLGAHRIVIANNEKHDYFRGELEQLFVPLINAAD